MVIELVDKKDCVSDGNRKQRSSEAAICDEGAERCAKPTRELCEANRKGKIDSSNRNYKGTMLKRITNRDRKRCFKCGHDRGMWFEYFLKGRREYHFLCQSCIDTIEGGK